MDLRIEIGREVQSPNAIQVPKNYNKVSRHHAFIYWQNGTVTIEDNGSTNGTFVNGNRVSKAQFNADDIIWLGGFGEGCYRLDVEQILESFHKAEEPQYNNNSRQDIKSNQDVKQTQLSNDDKPENYLGLAIVAALFNLIFGIVAIICSVRVNKLWEKGNKEGAEKASKNARGCSIVGLIIGIIGIIRFFLFML